MEEKKKQKEAEDAERNVHGLCVTDIINSTDKNATFVRAILFNIYF